MGKFTRIDFREVCERHGLLAPQSTVDAIWKEVSDRLAQDQSHPVRDFIAAYCDAFKAKYLVSPDIGDKDSGIAKRIVKTLGRDTAIARVQVYLSMKEFEYPWRHDLYRLELNLNAVKIRAETGRVQTRTEAIRDDRTEANKNAVQRFLERKRHGG